MKLFFVKKLVLPAFYALTTTALLLTLNACTTVEPASKRASALPIQTVSGNIAGARSYESGGRLYVSGSSKAVLSGGHVDVELIGAHGEVIAKQTSSARSGYAHPRTARGRSGNRPYVASFPLSEAGQASRIVVSYHHGGHQSAG